MLKCHLKIIFIIFLMKTEITVKNKLALGVVLLALAPACTKKKKDSLRPPENGVVSLHEDQVPSKRIKETFLDDADEFVLVEEDNPFTRTAKKGTPLLSEEDVDRAAYDRSEQSQYGLRTLYFDFDKFRVDESQKQALDENAQKIKELTDKGHTVVVEGHACRSAGSAVYNMMLSEKRANSVINHLVKGGVRKDKLKPVGRGFEMCVVQEGNRIQQKPNRRVEFRIIS